MNNRVSNNKNKFVFGVLAGAAAGALAGLLLAPDKGSVTRNNLLTRGRDTVDNFKGQVSDIVDKVSENYLSGNEESGRNDRINDRPGSNASNLNSPGSPGSRSFS